MGRPPFSSYPPEVAAKMRADLSEKKRQAWADRDRNGYGSRVNGMFNPGVSEKIAETVRQNWAERDQNGYGSRVNGMTGVTGSSHPNWTWGRESFSEICRQHHEPGCAICGTTEKKINVHHIDEDHGNYLLSNLIPICVECHRWQHGTNGRPRPPFVTISKTWSFEYSHILPWHPGKCARLHGHSGHLTVEIEGRLDQFGVVQDYYDVSRVVKIAVIDRYDHTFLNDVIENPTSENAVVFFWLRLEDAGLKGLTRVTFSETESTSCSVTKRQMIEAFGWDFIDDKWVFVSKPIDDTPEEGE